MNCSVCMGSSSVDMSVGGADSGIVSGIDSGADSGIVSGIDSGADSGIVSGIDSGADSSIVSGIDSGADSGIVSGIDSGADSGIDSGIDSGADSGIDSGADSGIDSGIDSGADSRQSRVYTGVYRLMYRLGSVAGRRGSLEGSGSLESGSAGVLRSREEREREPPVEKTTGLHAGPVASPCVWALTRQAQPGRS